jgi:hypothetical protein
MASQKCSRRLTTFRSLGLFLALGSLLMSGCDEGSGFVLSLQPAYTELDLDLDSGLNGTWAGDDGDVTFYFEQSEGRAYKLVVTEKTEGEPAAGEFQAHLLHLGAYSILDILPTGDPAGSPFYNMHLLRGHSFARVEFHQDSLQLTFFSGSWLKKKIEDHSVDVPHQESDGTLLLTGTTQEVQDLLFLYANDGEAFPDPLVLNWQEPQVPREGEQ